MTLYPLLPGGKPFGHFDFLDTDLASLVGGQVGVFDEVTRTNTSTEKAAYDALDGYVNDQIDVGTDSATRPVLRLADSSATDDSKAFFLLDDGTAGYGTLFGSVIGYPVGLSTTGTNLGPNTAAASGKVTAWHLPGLYAVSLDALASDVVPTAAGTNQYDTPLPGAILYREDATAKLQRATNANNEIALFVELSNNGSLVTTPAKLAGATETFDRITINYLGAYHNV